MPSPVDRYYREVRESNPSYSDEQAWATAWSIYCKHKNPGSEHCKKDPSEYLTKQGNLGLVVRVASRFVEAGDEGKIVGKDFRLTWGRHGWTLEELPQKGKRKLRVATLQNPAGYGGMNWDYYIPSNVLRDAKISPSDSYDHAKSKLKAAYSMAADATLSNTSSEMIKHFEYLRTLDWSEEQVYFLDVTPENVDPFKAEGKDFTVQVSWTNWSAFSPDSDFQSHDPSYTQLESSSPTAARKLYKLLKEDPNALKSISWVAFSDWLRKNKVDYKTHFSTWR